jgi:hypothetical protein
MGPFGLLSIIGSIWPRVLSLALVVGFVLFPHDADAAFMWAVHVEAAHIAPIVKHALESSLHHGCHGRTGSCPR